MHQHITCRGVDDSASFTGFVSPVLRNLETSCAYSAVTVRWMHSGMPKLSIISRQAVRPASNAVISISIVRVLMNAYLKQLDKVRPSQE